MVDYRETVTVAASGISISAQVNRSASGAIADSPLAPLAGVAGTLDTRTSDSNCVCDLPGHSFIVNDIVDVYWGTTGTLRHKMTVTVVVADDVTLDAGVGTVLPATTTPMIVSPRLEVDEDFDGDILEAIAATSDKRGHILFATAAEATIVEVELTANEMWRWVNGQGITNPFAGQVVAKFYISSGAAAVAAASVIGIKRST